MRLRHLLLAAGATGALAVPSTALAAWTAPVTVDSSSQANPLAVGAFGGSVVTGWLGATVALARRSGDAFGAAEGNSGDRPFQGAWSAGVAAGSDAIVLTVRRHKPLQRI